jgi:hypothetical protein
MMYLLICRSGGVFVNDLKLDIWVSLESMSSSHGHVYEILLGLQFFSRKQHPVY